MAEVTMKELLEAGVHFGHQTRRWNPKMSPYIYGERNGIHIVDLRQTVTQIADALEWVKNLVAEGGTVLFVGTKKQAQGAIAEHAARCGMPYIYGERNGIHIVDLRQTVTQIADALEWVKNLVAEGGTVLFVGTKKQAQGAIAEHAARCGMPYVNYRWLGGMLTNFATIQKRVYYMRELRRLEESGEITARPKKERLKLRRELEKLEANMGGISDMNRLPDAVFVIDVIAEETAVREADRLEIPIVALVDTNSDPDPVNFVIPGNDDAIRAADLIAGALADAVIEGKEIASKKKPKETEGDGEGDQ